MIVEFKEDYPLLIELGFVAINQCDEVSARRIFAAAQAISPGHVAPKIGLAYLELCKMEIKKATAQFSEVMKQDPENYMSQVFLGICYALTKGQPELKKKAEELIQISFDKTQDPTVKHLAQISLNWIRTDLSKKNAPFSVMPKQ